MGERGSSSVIVAVLAALGIMGVLLAAACAGLGLLYRSQLGRAREEAKAIAGRLSDTPRGQSLPPSPNTSAADYIEPEIPPAVTSGPHDQSLATGDAVVRVASITRGKVPLAMIAGEGASNAEHLLVRLSIENTSESSKLDFQGWNRPNDFVGPYAGMVDDIGNVYKRVDFGLGSKVLGLEPSQSIYPGKSIEAALVFELPVDAATNLTLVLPGKPLGTEGELRFEIPVEAVSILDARGAPEDGGEVSAK